jgi:predicted transcriptional regulator
MRTKDATTIELPNVLRDRLARLKLHERQAFHEVIEEALDVYEDLLRDGQARLDLLQATALCRSSESTVS